MVSLPELTHLKNASSHDCVCDDERPHPDLREHELHRAPAAVLDGLDLVVAVGAGGGRGALGPDRASNGFPSLGRLLPLEPLTRRG